MIPTLRALVACRSENPPGRCGAICRLVRDLLHRTTADEVRWVRVPSGNDFVVARWGTRPRLLVNAHLDTVPAGEGWRGDPFRLRAAGGRLYGRGTCDTKGAVAAIVAALRTERPRGLLVAFTSNEEHGNAESMRAFLASRWSDGLRDAIVSEPTELAVATAHRGILNLTVTVPGRSAHASEPERGVNAIARAAVFIVGLGTLQAELLERSVGGLRGSLINVGVIAGGVKPNMVPDRCEVRLGCRPLPGVSDLVRRVRHLAHRLAAGSRVARGFEGPALASPADCRAAGLLRRVGAGAPVGVSFWSEAALLARAGIRAVVFGPGSIREAHAPNEFVTRKQLEGARWMYEAIFRDLQAEATERRG